MSDLNTAADSSAAVSFQCELQGRCSGCAWLGRPYSRQLDDKRRELENLFVSAGVQFSGEPVSHSKIEMVSVAESRVRDRVDLTIQRAGDGKPIIGLYGADRAVVDMHACPEMTSSLETWFKDFRRNLPDVGIGSVRLRVSPNGQRGCWIDFSNIDIKTLLDEGTWLRSLLENGVVIEMGQKRKRVQIVDGLLKLRDPETAPWFETFVGDDERPVNLYCSVGSFTQTGFLANKVLTRELRRVVAQIKGDRWLELFCGIGNFTLPLASIKKNVTAFELDLNAVASLNRTLAEIGWQNRVEVIRGDAYKKGGLPDLSKFDAVVADPPRSGLKNVVTALSEVEEARRPSSFVYISCFAPTLAEDAARLIQLGYELKCVCGIDQFPQTPHCEWIAHFQR
jgi:23S rRNA (uracil1939-C5)-methyltransferase